MDNLLMLKKEHDGTKLEEWHKKTYHLSIFSIDFDLKNIDFLVIVRVARKAQGQRVR